MNIFERIRNFRKDPKRTRIYLSFGHSIRIKEQGECRKKKEIMLDYGPSAGAGTLGTEVNADGNTFANGLRVTNDESIYAQDPLLSINAFMPKDEVVDLETRIKEQAKMGESEDANVKKDKFGSAYNSENDIHSSENNLCCDERTNINCTSGKEIEKNPTRGRVFSQKYCVSFLLCDAIVAGGSIAVIKLLKTMFSK